MTATKPHTYSAEEIIAGFVLSAYMLGAKFGSDPYPGYVQATAATVLADLAEHGFTVTSKVTP